MNADDTLIAVWCEAADDILLLWKRSNVLEPEFVQVKSDEPNQLWTLARFCSRPSGKPSIIERSLNRYECQEESRFRIVVTRDLEPRLEAFTREIDHDSRAKTSQIFLEIHTDIKTKLGSVSSKSGGTLEYWLSKTVFQVVHSEELLKLQNLSRLERVLEDNSWLLASDQRAVVYEHLVRVAKDAADANAEAQPELKKLDRETVKQVLSKAVDDVTKTRPNLPLEQTLQAAGLSPQTIRGAKEATLSFEAARRDRQYYGDTDWERVEHSVGAELHRLWSEYEAGELDDSPQQFHARCLQALAEIQPSLSVDVPVLVLYGALYSRVKRGLLRFDRPSLRDVA